MCVCVYICIYMSVHVYLYVCVCVYKVRLTNIYLEKRNLLPVIKSGCA